MPERGPAAAGPRQAGSASAPAPSLLPRAIRRRPPRCLPRPAVALVRHRRLGDPDRDRRPRTGASVAVITGAKSRRDGTALRARHCCATLPGVNRPAERPARHRSGFAVRGARSSTSGRASTASRSPTRPARRHARPRRHLLLDDVDRIEVLKGSQCGALRRRGGRRRHRHHLAAPDRARDREPLRTRRRQLRHLAAAPTPSAASARGRLRPDRRASPDRRLLRRRGGRRQHRGRRLRDHPRSPGAGTLYLTRPPPPLRLRLLPGRERRLRRGPRRRARRRRPTPSTANWGLRGGSAFATPAAEHELALILLRHPPDLDSGDPRSATRRSSPPATAPAPNIVGGLAPTETVDAPARRRLWPEETSHHLYQQLRPHALRPRPAGSPACFAQSTVASRALTVNAAPRRTTVRVRRPDDRPPHRRLCPSHRHHVRASLGTGFRRPPSTSFRHVRRQPRPGARDQPSADLGVASDFGGGRGQARRRSSGSRSTPIEYGNAGFVFYQRRRDRTSQGARACGRVGVHHGCVLPGAYTYTDAAGAEAARATASRATTPTSR